MGVSLFIERMGDWKRVRQFLLPSEGDMKSKDLLPRLDKGKERKDSLKQTKFDP